MIATVTTPRSLLGIEDLAADELHALLDLAALMKRHPLAWRGALEGRAVACLFERPWTRGRVSLEVAVHRLGALPVVLERSGGIEETARLLSSYCDAIAIRTDHHRDLLDLAAHATVPVINALTDAAHPCRALADCLTLRERFGELAGLEVAYVGGREPAMHSLIEAAIRTGMTVHVAAPEALLPDPALLARAGTAVRVCESAREAVTDVVAVYAAAARSDLPSAFSVTPELLSYAAPRAVMVDASPDLLPVEQAVLRVLVTGDWEI
ncbi:ornithine carbamoyltransferase [Solirubrobacter phytolaccae]|uniref:Ornithine carbamoyltransferase n=1 Tax=Solirubrobacter phytolaccae TaxID=1404360 RepID=A0A9X3NBY5_9ACTN|nr:ornithine carbamoyltransferase [Solirubrobacter phytolaccae]MDA0181942.1 ornithine carbamoyltransferase [Solirubrobacter phytolaccae]